MTKSDKTRLMTIFRFVVYQLHNQGMGMGWLYTPENAHIDSKEHLLYRSVSSGAHDLAYLSYTALNCRCKNHHKPGLLIDLLHDCVLMRYQLDS